MDVGFLGLRWSIFFRVFEIPVRNRCVVFGSSFLMRIRFCFLSLHVLLQSQQVLEVQQSIHEGGVRLPQVGADRLDGLRQRGAKERSGGGGDHHRGGRIAGQHQGRGGGDPSAPGGAGPIYFGNAFVLQDVRNTPAPPLLPEIPAGQGVDRAMACLTDCHRGTERQGGARESKGRETEDERESEGPRN